MKKHDLDKIVEATMNSMDNIERATPAPFLLTRINAKMQGRQSYSPWEKFSAILTRPAIAFSLFVFLLLINVWIISTTVSTNNSAMNIQNLQASADEFSLNSPSSLFDFENPQP